jgi:putative peptidoglycan lipid II flippase
VPATVGSLGSEQPGPVTITGIQELDPPPGDGKENPAGLAALTDGDPATAWTTVCYESKYLYPKEGVGLVLGLSGPVAGQELRVQWPAGPWRASVYTAENPGADVRSWGQPVARRGSEQPGEARFALGSGNGRYVLLWLTQLARSDACSANPYRGAISELAVEPAG